MLNSTQFKTLNIEDLLPGMVIIRVVKQNGPIKIKKSGLVTSLDMVQGLIEMGIQQIEIDPDQTVEFEDIDNIGVDSSVVTSSHKKVKKSATQKMLQSNNLTNSRIEDNLSSQFHRSLFLPTVQSIPSRWQYFARRYTLVSLMAIGGFGFGWISVNYQLIVDLFPTEPEISHIETEQQKPVNDQSAPLLKNEQDTNIDSLQPDVELNIVPSSQLQEIVTNLPRVDINITQVDHNQYKTSATSTDLAKVELEPSEVSQGLTEVEATPKISADLLKKFNQAIAQVAESPVNDAPQVTQGTNTENLNSVPRVDQLSAWVLTELPSMSFSAHMYASEQNERWVRVNGTRMVEGDVIDKKVTIISIEPQRVILNYAGQEFSMAALTDW